ncbi:hypothetical protein [Roseinatronobacter bogoriensis]|uniref:hypothetical protein n=1 Tax=Roseinatronobacter bogoriensis TaxID=119542 RepID=UPI001066F97C|nr:hypothetical protein [Rhodobaca bogoriensis]MBB4207285.1 hypothetical protein [Rhodobaca bogoriensis DSM 18756]
MDGAADRARNDRARMWLSAWLIRHQKPPTFEQFVDPPKRQERQSPDVMNAMLSALAAAWGAEKVH